MFFLYMREEYAVEDQHQHVVGGKNQRKGQKARLVALPAFCAALRQQRPLIMVTKRK